MILCQGIEEFMRFRLSGHCDWSIHFQLMFIRNWFGTNLPPPLLADPQSNSVKFEYKLCDMNALCKTCFDIHLACNYLMLLCLLYPSWPLYKTQQVITRRHETDMFLEPNIWT